MAIRATTADAMKMNDESYTRSVRRSLAAFLLAAIFVVFGFDQIACPDGCGDESSTSRAAVSSCLLCHSGVSVSAVHGSSAPTTVAHAVLPLRVASLPSVPPPTIDHPPRRA
jgi:hypothetical protein